MGRCDGASGEIGVHGRFVSAVSPGWLELQQVFEKIDGYMTSRQHYPRHKKSTHHPGELWER